MAMADSGTLADLAWLGAFFKVSEEVILQSPPPDVRNKLVRCFGAYRRAGGRPYVVPRAREQCGPKEGGK
jgi:hypothetical protein